MTGRRRKPRPAGTANVICTGRGRHERVVLWVLTAASNGAETILNWNAPPEHAPVTFYTAEDGRVGIRQDAGGWHTFEFRCTGRGCRIHRKLGEQKLADLLRNLAVAQEVTGNKAVEFDISMYEGPT